MTGGGVEVVDVIRRRWPWLAGALLVLAAGAALTVVLVGGGSANAPDVPVATVSGVPVPALSADCLGQDRGGEWLSSPWLAEGRVVALDHGRPVTMTAAQATARGIAGDPVEGVWLCPPP